MSKELEVLYKIVDKLEFTNKDDYWEVRNAYTKIEQALQRLGQIDNTDPSKVLEYLEHIKENNFNMMIATYPPLPAYNGITKNEMFTEIKQALIKSQEQEKVLEIIKEHLSFKDDSFTYSENNQEKVQLSIVIESKDTECSIHINFKKQEEFDLLKRYLENKERR